MNDGHSEKVNRVKLAESQADAMASPCVRNCCLDQNDVCMGCFRTLDEIVGWGSKANAQKAEILINCAERRKRSCSQSLI